MCQGSIISPSGPVLSCGIAFRNLLLYVFLCIVTSHQKRIRTPSTSVYIVCTVLLKLVRKRLEHGVKVTYKINILHWPVFNFIRYNIM